MDKKRVMVAAALLGLAGTVSAGWSSWSHTDEMTGDTWKGVVSEETSPQHAMAFPYAWTIAVVGLSCNGTGAYFRFSENPNLTKDRPGDGYSTSSLRARFDAEAPRNFRFTQEWGSDQLATDSALMRNGILERKVLRLELPWHGQGNVIFKFDLAGSRAAYQAACPGRISRDREKTRARKAAEARRQAVSESMARERSEFGKDWEKARRHVEASGWSCPKVESVRLHHEVVMVICTGGMQYFIRQDRAVMESRGSGKRL